jgi:hypothetical protein
VICNVLCIHRKNLVHFNHMFVTSVQLLSRSTQFVTMFIIVFYVTIVASTKLKFEIYD